MRRILARAALVAVVCLMASAGVQAQAYPNKPIRMVVPYAPGGATGIVKLSGAKVE